jgi:hypothetical protein
VFEGGYALREAVDVDVMLRYVLGIEQLEAAYED